MKLRLFTFLSILLLTLLSACGSEDTETKDNLEKDPGEVSEESTVAAEEEAEDEEANTYEPFSSIEMEDVTAWMNAGPGLYPGDAFDEETIKVEIEKWPTNLNPEDYFHRLLALTAEDYEEYQTFIDTIEVEFESPSSRPDSEIEEEEEEKMVQNTLNIQILLDASGSMAGQVDGGVKMDLAKESITEFAAQLPENAQVSLRVYGHEGNNQLDGKELSCATTEEVYSMGTYDKANFASALEQFGPTGYTPLAAAIEAAGEDLAAANEPGTQSVVYVVSDGVETCEGDPVEAAKNLQQSDIEAIVNIIGFDIKESERAALEAIAEAGAGQYFRADTAQELRDTMRKERQELRNAWQEWINKNVDKNNEEVSSYLEPAYNYEEDALEKSYREEERQRELTYFMEEISEDIDAIEIRSLIQDRTISMRQHIRREFVEIRQEARKKGLELRQNVREEGHDEIQDLRKEENNE